MRKSLLGTNVMVFRILLTKHGLFHVKRNQCVWKSKKCKKTFRKKCWISRSLKKYCKLGNKRKGWIRRLPCFIYFLFMFINFLFVCFAHLFALTFPMKHSSDFKLVSCWSFHTFNRICVSYPKTVTCARLALGYILSYPIPSVTLHM